MTFYEEIEKIIECFDINKKFEIFYNLWIKIFYQDVPKRRGFKTKWYYRFIIVCCL